MGDLINRQAAIDGLDKLRPRMIDTYERDGDCFLKVRACDVNDMLQSLPSAQSDEKLRKIADLVEGSIDHFDRDDAMDLLYQIKDVVR